MKMHCSELLAMLCLTPVGLPRGKRQPEIRDAWLHVKSDGSCVVQEYKRRSRDIETETEEDLLLFSSLGASSGSLSSSISISDRSISTDYVEEYIGDVPFAGKSIFFLIYTRQKYFLMLKLYREYMEIYYVRYKFIYEVL
jgi:hypothetical protein